MEISRQKSLLNINGPNLPEIFYKSGGNNGFPVVLSW
jgi:hypothetical protein